MSSVGMPSSASLDTYETYETFRDKLPDFGQGLPTYPATFERFPELPTEVQLMIWRAAFPSKNLFGLFCKRICTYDKCLEVGFDSRNEVLRFYETPITHPAGYCHYFDPCRNVIRLLGYMRFDENEAKSLMTFRSTRHIEIYKISMHRGITLKRLQCCYWAFTFCFRVLEQLTLIPSLPPRSYPVVEYNRFNIPEVLEDLYQKFDKLLSMRGESKKEKVCPAKEASYSH
ncbi:hypothetical protein G7Y89_g9031 [Cudoniella acicularis]|uniref:2EXR domain-containing protein n=1 Tax=Cudoniella acicularis TaxID=354080 RepID=A0A8H4RI81_9HELO|nr:hypothetical protein G7Y89_g9031 [Cudoniella acicularis]